MGKPPIGEKRFRRPEPVDPWPGEFNATTKPNACFNLLDEVFGGSSQKQSIFTFLWFLEIRFLVEVDKAAFAFTLAVVKLLIIKW